MNLRGGKCSSIPKDEFSGLLEVLMERFVAISSNLVSGFKKTFRYSSSC